MAWKSLIQSTGAIHFIDTVLMKTRRRAREISTSALALLALCIGLPLASAADSLDSGFRNPPPEARPWVYWFFMDGNMTREGITADLEAMAKAGLGGGIFMEVDVGIPRGPVEFMSLPWQELLRHAVKEAERLGLELTVNASPGWTGSGGPWIRPEQSMQHLVASETNIAGPSHFEGLLAKPAPRQPFFGEGTLTPELKKARDDFYRDVVVLAFPTPAGQGRIADIDEKALYYRAPYSSQPGVKPFLPAPAEHPALPADQCIAPDRIVDLTRNLSSDGRLEWNVPEGNWTVLRFGRRSTGQTTRPAPLPGLGFECDKFDPAALDAHYGAFIRTLLSGLGPRTTGHGGWTMLHIDSWEMSSQNWTALFREEFQRRRGYDLLNYLPVMTGRVVGNLEVSERFLWDLRQTAQELVVENHASHLRELGRRDGLGLSIEPYDLNPCADLSLGGAASVPMCEFWAKGHGFHTEFSAFEAVSIAHTLARPIVAAESFTSGDTERWQLYPGALKGQGDWALCAGVNRFVFHRYQHQPWLDRAPGMTMGPYGVHWERTQTWWEMAAGYHQYLSRCQFLLRRGLPVADICYLAGEGAPHVFRPPKSATRGDPPDRLGYNFDGCAPEVLMNDASVSDDGRLVFPGGMSYRVLVLPRFDTMTPALLRKIKDLVQAGATVVGAPPRKSPGLSNYPECDLEVKRLAAELWGEPAVSEKQVGKGRIVWDADAVQAGSAGSAGLKDLAQARWIWHPEGNPAVSAPVGKRYFKRTLVIPAGLDIQSARFSMTADNSFELWVNGKSAGAGDNFHQLCVMDLAPLLNAGPNVLAVVAVNSGDQPNPAGLIGSLAIQFKAGKPLAVHTDGQWASAATVGDDWLTNNTPQGGWVAALDLGPYGMSPWNQIEDPAGFPDIYPDYPSAARLLAGMNVSPDFDAEPFLRYTHRHDGDADIYFVANPEARPLEAKATFRVSGRQPELWDPLTGEQRALPEFAQRAGRTSVPLRFEPHQSFFIVLRKPAGTQPAPGRNFEDSRPVQTIDGPWEVAFQPGRGAPERVRFDTLTDWSKNSEPGVRYFSGIATYRTQFDWEPRRSRLFLELGQVQVMAGVRLNGVDLGPVWTAPFRVEVTAALKPGPNLLEIRVANLWPNRLIGDAALPADQRVAWTTWNPFEKNSPLLPSGLIGPVRLAAEGQNDKE
jgi:hypothetical protein